MKQFRYLAATCAFLACSGVAHAQYPTITAEAQARFDSLQKAWIAHSDSAWKVAFPIVVKEAMHGRPYVPWAFRPYDLKQAKIPAFPGAEGAACIRLAAEAGKYSW